MMMFNRKQKSKMFISISIYSFLVIGIVIALVNAGNDPNCGIKGPKPPSTLEPIFGAPRIIGGEDALPGEFPWQCYIRNTDVILDCGASLINSRFILTAGHCVQDEIKDITVVCGTNTLLTKSKTEVRVGVAKQIGYPGHPGAHSNSKDAFRNDIALMKLERDLDLSQPTLGSVCLPEGNEPLDFVAGKYAIATGWGEYKHGSHWADDKLQKVLLKVWKQDDCSKAWAHSNHPKKIAKDNMCIGQGEKTTCHGDSGGPLVHFNQATKRWTTYGVTSFGNASCIGPIPPVDTRVSVFVKWIWDTVAANSD